MLLTQKQHINKTYFKGFNLQKNYMVNVLISSQEIIKEVAPGGGLTHLQFGPCTEEDGEKLADRINAWGRGLEGGGLRGLYGILGVDASHGDLWASCDPILMSNVGDLIRKLQDS